MNWDNLKPSTRNALSIFLLNQNFLVKNFLKLNGLGCNAAYSSGVGLGVRARSRKSTAASVRFESARFASGYRGAGACMFLNERAFSGSCTWRTPYGVG